MIMVEFKKKNSGYRSVYNISNVELHDSVEGAYLVGKAGVFIQLEDSYARAIEKIEIAINNHYGHLKDGVE